ncbi:MAG: BON domain-containing protein [Candidatus Rokubacteria bacterium]|nr:BON domain-containing protein [Candidatus Rokubacteria bacterium]
MTRLVWLSAIALVVAAGIVPAAAQDKPTLGERVDDAAITAKVKAKLTTDRAKNLFRVDVDTRQGIVHLQGTVATDEDKFQAEALARNTDGVREVKNDLVVQPRAGEAPAGAASPRTR